VINVYMSNNPHEKLQCWNSLLDHQAMSSNSHLIITGDFNTTLHSKEKRGGSLVRDPSRENLEDLISSLDLSDIKSKKRRYTWTNRRMGKGHIATHV
jgi:endonuclease/exonuclease/phosphatase family metal-dependent hydrolase